MQKFSIIALALFQGNNLVDASNNTATTAAAGNTTVTVAATNAAGNGTTGTTKAATPAATTAATAAATKAPAAAASTAAGNTTATTVSAATNRKLRVTIPDVKVSVDFTKVNTPALKTQAAKAIFDGVKKESCVTAAGFADVTECDAGKAGKLGMLYAKFDNEFGTLTDTTMTTGYDAARRRNLQAKETTNNFKFIITVPAADAATTKTALNTKLGETNTFSQTKLAAAIGANWNTAALGNVTVTFVKPAGGMAAEEVAVEGAGTSTSGAFSKGGVDGMLMAVFVSMFVMVGGMMW